MSTLGDWVAAVEERDRLRAALRLIRYLYRSPRTDFRDRSEVMREIAGRAIGEPFTLPVTPGAGEQPAPAPALYLHVWVQKPYGTGLNWHTVCDRCGTLRSLENPRAWAPCPKAPAPASPPPVPSELVTWPGKGHPAHLTGAASPPTLDILAIDLPQGPMPPRAELDAEFKRQIDAMASVEDRIGANEVAAHDAINLMAATCKAGPRRRTVDDYAGFSLKRLAWAYGCAKKGSPEEWELHEALLHRFDHGGPAHQIPPLPPPAPAGGAAEDASDPVDRFLRPALAKCAAGEAPPAESTPASAQDPVCVCGDKRSHHFASGTGECSMPGCRCKEFRPAPAKGQT